MSARCMREHTIAESSGVPTEARPGTPWMPALPHVQSAVWSFTRKIQIRYLPELSAEVSLPSRPVLQNDPGDPHQSRRRKRGRLAHQQLHPSVEKRLITMWESLCHL